MAYQAQHESGRATVADDPYDNAFAESLLSPPEGGVTGRWSVYNRR